MSKISLVTVTNGQNISAMNSNFSAIQTHLNTLVTYRQNPVGEPNEMHNDLDFNGFRILNLSELNVTSLVVNGVDIAAQVASAQAAAAAASASASNANSSAVSAATSASNAAATLAGSLLKANNLGDLVDAPTARSNLGLGTAATQSSATFLQTANNLSDVTAATARTNLGLTSAATTAIGTSGATLPLLSTANTWTLAQTGSAGYSIDNTVASNARTLTYKTSGSLRWNLSVDATAEGGSNAGSDYNISRYSDAGSFVDTPFKITRSTGAITVTGLFTPSATVGIKGTATNDSAQAGSFGEYQTASATAVSLTTSTNTNVTSLSLTAGDWDVQINNKFNIAAGATVTSAGATVTTTTGGGATLGQTTFNSGISATNAIGVVYVTSPVVRFSLSGTTTIFATGIAVFSGGTVTVDGLIRARRIR